jgi:trans-aconitate methyltransferase
MANKVATHRGTESHSQRGPVEFDGQRYRQTSAHQKEWGSRLISELALSGDESILDIGCGDGILTAQLADRVPRGRVTGIDASVGMIEAARTNERPNLSFVQIDICCADFAKQFDVVFSNATLHWIKDHTKLLRLLHRSLKNGGTLRVNFAADGNCETLFRVAHGLIVSEEFREAFTGFEWPWFMPAIDEYQRLLADSPFTDFKVWGENADRYFPTVEAMLGWVDHPSIVPFKRHLKRDVADRFHQLAAARMVELTKQPNGTCFETFRRINVSARK